MSLDKIEEFEQLTFKQWVALGNSLGGIDVVKGLLRHTMKATVEIVRRLSALTSVTVKANEISPHDFFQTREGLWISDDFKELILSGAWKNRVSTSETVISYADILDQEGAEDVEIQGELPEGYVFEDVDIFLVHIATLIEEQWGGRDGVLLNNDYYDTIFYVKVKEDVFIVNVHWCVSGSSRWRCDAHSFDDGLWPAGDRIFSATAP